MTSNSDLRRPLPALTLGALGVVYGDIGTSPLYTLKEVFGPATGVPLDARHIVGAVSVIFWGLMLVVTLKYVILILRADNRGEGGIMALTALVAHAAGSNVRRRRALLAIGVFGAALFYGDSVITPAISVLSAVEGLNVATPALESMVLPIAVTVLLALFIVQRRGTGTVGALFGPVIAVWFAVLGATGVAQIVSAPAILAALDPREAFAFLHARGWRLFAAVGAIVLAFTGAEALYADMGHFGRRPIQLAWIGLVMPALALNYMGQGALLMREPGALEHPFYRLFAPAWLLPAVVLATLATVIASQAVISGAYSMTRQAMQLGFLPRLRVAYTSASEAGQIYMPEVNWVLLAAVVIASIGFGSSSALASAYGIAVTGTMLITTVLTFFVVRHAWGYPLPIALGATGFFLVLDALLVASCALKFWQGGWFPLVLGAAIYAAMATWQRGRELLLERIRSDDLPLAPFVAALSADVNLARTARTAVYAVANADTVPQALLHNLKHNQVLHEQVVLLTVRVARRPRVPDTERVEVADLAPGFKAMTLTFGFMETPNVAKGMALARAKGLKFDIMRTSFFLSRRTLLPRRGAGLGHLQDMLFVFLTRNAVRAADFFQIPPSRVVELGAQVAF